MCSLQEQLSNLFGSYKAEWLKEDIFNLFAEPSYLPELTTLRPCILVGGRGTGKTTVLRGLSYQGQFALLGNNKESIQDWSYIGLYHRVNTNRVSAFKGPEINEQNWIKLFSHYFNILACELMTDFLKWYLDMFPDSPNLATYDIKAITNSLNIETAKDTEELRKNLQLAKIQFEAHVNSIGDGIPSKLSMPGAPIEIMASSILKLKQFSNKKFYILLDEYENLENYQQQIVNTLIKHTTESHTFKIGVREIGWRVKTTMNPKEVLNSPADYVMINIAEKLQGGNFEDFARTVCNRRLEKLNIGINGSFDVKDTLVGLSDLEEADMLGLAVKTKRIKTKLQQELGICLTEYNELQIYFLAMWAKNQDISLKEAYMDSIKDKHKWEERYQNYKHALLYTIRQKKTGINKYYAGWDTFVKLAGDNIRYLMELVEQSFLANLLVGNEITTAISPKIQTEVAKKVARKNLFELEGLSTDGARIIKLIFGLGRIFETLAKSYFKHAPELNQFNVTDSSEESTGTVEELLKSSVMNLAILRSVGSKLNTPKETRGEFDYMIHPIFAPFFGYSYRKKRKISLTTDEIIQLIHNHRKTIDTILKRYKVEAQINSQELLFNFEGQDESY